LNFQKSQRLLIYQTYTGTEWSLKNVKYLANEELLIILELKHKYTRNDSRFNFAVPAGSKEYFALKLDRNMEVVRGNIVYNGDELHPTEDGGWITVFNKQSAIIKYSNELKSIYLNLLGKGTSDRYKGTNKISEHDGKIIREAIEEFRRKVSPMLIRKREMVE